MSLLDRPATTLRPFARDLVARSRSAPLWLAGADLGNTTALLAVDGQYQQIPSLIGTGDLSALLATRGGAGSEGRLYEGEYALEYQGQTWYVGELAASQSADATTDRGNPTRQANGHALRLLLTLVGVLDPQITSVRLRLVTGLPIKQFKSSPQLRAQIAESLIGTHVYRLHDCIGVREMQVTIEAVIVGMEGAMVAQAFNTPGQPSGFIDIGGDSFDIGWIDANGRLVESRTDSLFDAGAERIAATLSRQFSRQHGRELTAAERAMVLEQYQAGADTVIYQDGMRTITTDQVAEAVRQVAERGDTFLQQKWGARPGSDGAQIRLLGGAARLWHPTVYAPLVASETPEADNALAFAAFAQRFEAASKWPATLLAEVR